MLFNKIICLSIAMLIITMVETKEVSRTKRQAELPAGFQCSLCDRCNKPCKSECQKCAGCDLIKALNLPPEQAKLYGAGDCDTFCKDGVAGCVATCEAAEEGCKFCQYC
eukprot:TRINITY_DN9948_c0_g1_i1.p1 TRINITY_DN9948_c0_g1~~TRINITY_DN9948_c0_g1_i1.p1  ORF type:complete len:109 (-),score=23.95 TRINITY_DN9948_c0_g1_i1:183-509(-)